MGDDKGRIIRESEWMRVYESPTGEYHESKFMTGEASITPERLAASWPAFEQSDKLDFIHAYMAHFVPEERPQYDKIIGYLIANEQEFRGSLPILATFMTDRDAALDFLLAGARDPSVSLRGNFIQGLEILGDKRAVPELETLLRSLRETPNLQNDRSAASLCVACARALDRLEPHERFQSVLEEFSKYPDLYVAHDAKMRLRKKKE